MRRRQKIRQVKQNEVITATSKCTCPDCGHSEPHKRGVPCLKTKCPKCGTTMRGERCFN